MNSYDFDAVTYDSDIYCVECLPDDISVDNEDVSPIFADQEWDVVPVCCVCGTEHDYVTVLGDESDESAEPVSCDQCEAAMINGVFCHEQGCPNQGKVFECGEWVKYWECRECGCDVRDGESCDCMEVSDGI